MKKYFYWFLGAFFVIWFLLMGMVAVIDPFFHYHAPLDHGVCGPHRGPGNRRSFRPAGDRGMIVFFFPV